MGNGVAEVDRHTGTWYCPNVFLENNSSAAVCIDTGMSVDQTAVHEGINGKHRNTCIVCYPRSDREDRMVDWSTHIHIYWGLIVFLKDIAVVYTHIDMNSH
jgi:hypothetical protein